MYYSPGYTGTAMKRYAAVHTGSRVEGASPHELVRILFDELQLAIEASALALKNGDTLKSSERHVRALSILHALDSSLDFDKGGDVAISLAQIYRESRRLLIASYEGGDPAHARSALVMISEIASAWNQIM